MNQTTVPSTTLEIPSVNQIKSIDDTTTSVTANLLGSTISSSDVIGSAHKTWYGTPEDTRNDLMNSTSTSTRSSDTAFIGDETLFEGFGKGILRDYKMRLPFFKDDIKDGLSSQCLATTMSLFFACLAPAIGFGALFGVATGNETWL